MKRVIWSPQAQRDLIDLILWYQDRDADLPERLIRDIEAAAAKLIDFPRLGSVVPDSDVRKWRAGRTPFLIFYRPVSGGVRVLDVRHEATDWKPRR